VPGPTDRSASFGSTRTPTSIRRTTTCPAAERDRALDALRARVERVYLHVDLDVLDVSVGRANAYAAPGGPDLDGVLAAIEATFLRFAVVAAAITAYDPRLDDDGAIAAAATAIAARIGALARA
jgi:arginase